MRSTSSISRISRVPIPRPRAATSTSTFPSINMNEHYIVAVDAGHLRIYAQRQKPGQFTPGFEQIEAMDFPAGKASYTDRDTDVAGRFQSSKPQGAGTGTPA